MKRPLSKQTKIQRYKQIEKEIEHDRRIRQDEMKIIEEKENKKSKEFKEKATFYRNKFEQEEEARKNDFVRNTIHMMKKFEENHPSLEFSQKFENHFRDELSPSMLSSSGPVAARSISQQNPNSLRIKYVDTTS